MSRPVRTVFLGSGAFGIPTLRMLAEHRSVELAGVVTAPARPAGRGRRLTPSAVGAVAEAMSPVVLTPERLRAPEAVAAVASLDPGLLVLADYGQIVPAPLLALPARGALNLHPSLLPRHRGATPVAAAILAGDERTGVSLMRMDEGLDTGPLIAVREKALRGDETAPDLEADLARLAADLLSGSLPSWLAGSLPAVPQALHGASLTRPLRRADGRLDPDRPAVHLERQVRALQPWPGSFLETPEGRLVVWRSRVLPPDPARATWDHAPGAVGRSDGELVLATGEGLLALLEVQPSGGRRMEGSAYARGRAHVFQSLVPGGAVG